MLCFTLVIFAFILPSFAKEGSKISNSTTCSDPRVQKIGDDYFNCFYYHVNNSITHGKLNCTTPLRKTFNDYVKLLNETCQNGTAKVDTDSPEFHNLIDFSLKNDNFKEFVETGGVKCIQAIKYNVTRCIMSEVGNVFVQSSKGFGNKYVNLWKKTKLTIDMKSCKQTQNIKMCTLKAMRSETKYKCNDKINHMLYVSSLFDYMLERCHEVLPKWGETVITPEENILMRPPVKIMNADNTTTHALLAIILTLAILGFVYVIARDCRTSNFKIPVEHFSMKRRRRSLVHNEACNEN